MKPDLSHLSSKERLILMNRANTIYKETAQLDPKMAEKAKQAFLRMYEKDHSKLPSRDLKAPQAA